MKAFVLAATAVIMGAAAVLLARVAQDPAYHNMADQRSLLGIPHALNVLSNLPFLVCGGSGLALVHKRVADWTRWPYAVFFAATMFVAAGSTYYHLAPDNGRLLWDRLPMAVAFAALLTAVIADRVGVGPARLLFIPLMVLGAGSVLYWAWSEAAGAGDLRAYAVTQFGSLLTIVLVMALYREHSRSTRYLVGGLCMYGIAKVLELADQPIYALGHIVSGHTLKHAAAAGGVACVAMMLNVRGR
jgi:ceramidase